MIQQDDVQIWVGQIRELLDDRIQKGNEFSYDVFKVFIRQLSGNVQLVMEIYVQNLGKRFGLKIQLEIC